MADTRAFGLGSLVLAMAVLAGCGVSKPLLLEEDPDVAAVKELCPAPKGWKVAVAPVSFEPGTETGADEWVPALDPRELTEAALEALRSTEVFSRVDLQGAAGEEDLVLRLRVVGALGRFEGTNGRLLAQMALWWSLSSLLGCLVADEDYSLSLEIEGSLSRAGTTDVIWSGSVPATFRASLDHYQKGVGVFDLLPPGTFLARHDAHAVTAVLAPHLLRAFQVALARTLAEEVPVPVVDLCVACGPDPAPFVAAFRAGRDRVELASPAATADGVRAALSALAARKDVRIRDLVLYFAPGDGKPAGLDLAELSSLLRAVAAGTRVAVLDAVFPGEGAVPMPGKADGLGLLFLSNLRSSGAAPSALLLPHLIEGRTRANDADKDGILSISELAGPVSWAAARALRRVGAAGAPAAVGDGAVFRIGKEEKEEKTPPEGDEESERDGGSGS